MKNQEISDGRKFCYYFGMAMMGFGFLLFISFFFTASSVNLPDPREMNQAVRNNDFEAVREGILQSGESVYRAQRRGAESFQTAVIGFLMIIGGGGLMQYGRLGAAGSGFVLDPERARGDVKPWSGMVGGVVSDVVNSFSKSQSENGSKDLATDTQKLIDDSESRIMTLKSLLEKGLITQEEFDEKRKSIISGI
jgi:hypothetical protein